MSERAASAVLVDMDPADAVPLLADPVALVRRLRRDGYLYFRELLAPGVVRQAGEEMERTLDELGWLPGQASETSIVAKAGRQEGSEGWWAGYTRVQALESFHRLAYEPRLSDVVAALFPTSITHVRKIANIRYPDFGVPPHQDYPAVQGAVDTLTAWVPLTTRTASSGVLRVLPGSSRLGVLPMRSIADAGAEIADVPGGEWRQFPYAAGDVVLLHSLTVHEMTPNRSADVVLSCDFRYQDARDRVCEASLLPHHYPRVPSARVLSRGWSSRRWVRRPLLARRTPFLMPPTIEQWHEHLPVAEARLAEAAGPPPQAG